MPTGLDLDPAPFAPIVRRLDPQAVVERAWPLKGGISAQMTAVAYRDGDGRSQAIIVRRPSPWMLEIHDHAAQYEFDVLTAVRDAGALVPRAYFYDESGTVLPDPFLVIEYLPGEVVFRTNDVDGYGRQLAEQLVRIHAIDPQRPILRDLPQHAASLDQSILGDVELDESIDHGRVLEVLRPVWPLPAANAPALLHRDIWPGNLVWRDGRLAGVIDWEDAAIGEPLADVSVARLDLLWAFGWPMVDAFTSAYRQFTTIDMSQLPYWDLVAAIRPANELSFWAVAWPDVGRPDLNSATMRAGQRDFAARALAAVG